MDAPINAHSFLNFLAYAGTGIGVLILAALAVSLITPHRELSLIRSGNAAAATGFAGTLVGLALPLHSAISNSVSLVDAAIWGAAAVVVQVFAYLIARLVAPMRRAADRAASAGISLALENHGDMRARDILELFDRTDRPNLGVCLDNVNLIRVGDDMLDGTAALAPHTLLVQLKDHRPGDPTVVGGPVSTALGEGVAPIDEVIEILDRNGFAGPVCVELASLGGGPVDELAMIERSMDWLRTHIPVAAG